MEKLKILMKQLGVKIQKNEHYKNFVMPFELPESYLYFLDNYSKDFGSKDIKVFCSELNELVDIFDVIPSKYNSFEEVLNTYKDRIGKDYLPIFISNGGGDLILINNLGIIYYWSHEENKTYHISDDFIDFIQKLKV